MSSEQVFRVLSVDSGGMRGYYSAAYLQELSQLAMDRFGATNFDLSTKFQLIVGTSTGAIVGAGLFAGLSPNQIMNFYAVYGKKIFPKRLPSNSVGLFLHRRKRLNQLGTDALRDGLTEAFGEISLGELYQTRGIAFAVPAVDATTQKLWIFKTPHNRDSNHRDDEYSLVDVCLASSAAPIYRSVATVKQPRRSGTDDIFVDGGLCANNPVLVALSEALKMTKNHQRIDIFCLGTSPKIVGDALDSDNPHWGLLEWRFGGKALEMSLNAQAGVFDYLADSFLPHLNRNVTITRFPQRIPSTTQTELLGLDCSSKKSLDLMRQFVSRAADDANRVISGDSPSSKVILSLLTNSQPSITISNLNGD